MARSSGSVSARQADHAPRRRVSASAGRPAAMASAPSTLSRWAPGAKSAISPRCAAALAASPFWSIQVTASSTRRCRSAACGLCRAASTRLAVAAGHAWRSASRRANASRSAASAASGTVAAATRCRSTAAGSVTNAAAAVCSALRRATPSESCTADRTSGCGKATVTGVPGPGSAMRPAAVVSSNGASGSSSPANDATCGSGLCMPSTAAASTRSRAAAEQPDQRSLTTRRNERGEGSGHSPVPHDLRRELGEQRPGVQRVAPCAVAQATGGHRRQRRSELGREVAQLGLGEPGQRDGGARLPVDDPAKALRQPGDRVPYADQDQHLVGDQPPQCEQQRRERRPVGPVRVVDDHHDHSLVACLVVAVEQSQQPRADGDRVVERPGRAGDRRRVEPARPGQLFDDPVGQQRLRLVATRPQHRRRQVPAGVGEEPLDQRGLAHPGRALRSGRPADGGRPRRRVRRAARPARPFGRRRVPAATGATLPHPPLGRTRSSDPTPREGARRAAAERRRWRAAAPCPRRRPRARRTSTRRRPGAPWVRRCRGRRGRRGRGGRARPR